jgi:hypothetical protein
MRCKSSDRLVRNKSAMEASNRANGEIFSQSVDADGNRLLVAPLVHKDSPSESTTAQRDKSWTSYRRSNSTPALVPTSSFSPRTSTRACFKTLRNASHEANGWRSPSRSMSAQQQRKRPSPNDRAGRYSELRII